MSAVLVIEDVEDNYFYFTKLKYFSKYLNIKIISVIFVLIINLPIELRQWLNINRSKKIMIS